MGTQFLTEFDAVNAILEFIEMLMLPSSSSIRSVTHSFILNVLRLSLVDNRVPQVDR